MQASIWRRCIYVQQTRKPESKGPQVVGDCDIPGREREANFKENLICELIKEPEKENLTIELLYTFIGNMKF